MIDYMFFLSFQVGILRRSIPKNSYWNLRHNSRGDVQWSHLPGGGKHAREVMAAVQI